MMSNREIICSLLCADATRYDARIGIVRLLQIEIFSVAQFGRAASDKLIKGNEIGSKIAVETRRILTKRAVPIGKLEKF